MRRVLGGVIACFAMAAPTTATAGPWTDAGPLPATAGYGADVRTGPDGSSIVGWSSHERVHAMPVDASGSPAAPGEYPGPRDTVGDLRVGSGMGVFAAWTSAGGMRLLEPPDPPGTVAGALWPQTPVAPTFGATAIATYRAETEDYVMRVRDAGGDRPPAVLPTAGLRHRGLAYAGGRVTAAWTSRDDAADPCAPERLWLSTAALGATASAPVPVSTAGRSVRDVSIAAAPDGSTTAAWLEYPPSEPSALGGCTLATEGTAMVAEVSASGDIGPAVVLPGQPAATSDVHVVRDAAGGATFAVAGRNPGPGGRGLWMLERNPSGHLAAVLLDWDVWSWSPVLAADDAGRAVVAWRTWGGQMRTAWRSPDGAWSPSQAVTADCGMRQVVRASIGGGRATLLVSDGNGGLRLFVASVAGPDADRPCPPQAPAHRPPRPVRPASPAAADRPLLRTPLATLRLAAPARRASRRVQVRVACPEGCALRLRIRPRAGGRALVTRATTLVRGRPRSVTLVVPKRAERRWRGAKAGTYVVEAVARKRGFAPTTRTVVLRPVAPGRSRL